MIRNTLISSAEPTREHLAMFKQYASVPDSSRDALLNAMLKRAFLVIQEVTDKSLLSSEFELTVDERERGDEFVRLYGTPVEVLSVKNGAGHDVAYHWAYNVISLEEFAAEVRIRYKTAPVMADAVRLLPKVYAYATALYDGDTEEQNKILASC